MATLPPADVSNLLKKGFTSAQINAYKAGTADAATKSRIQIALALAAPTAPKAAIPKPAAFGALGSLATANKAPFAVNAYGGAGANVGSIGAPSGLGGAVAGPRIQNTSSVASAAARGAAGARAYNPVAATGKAVTNTTGPSNGGYYDTAGNFGFQGNNPAPVLGSGMNYPGGTPIRPGISNPGGSTAAVDPMAGYPGAPTQADPYVPTQISLVDKTPEGNAAAASAFAPLFEALASAKTGAQGQYNTSDTVVKGLYDKLQADVNASGVKQAAQYDQSGADAAARAQALQDRQGQIYNANAAQQSGLMAQLGQQQAAGDILAPQTGELSFQQGEAAASGKSQQDMYAAGKQASNDYTTGVANATGTQGTVAREGLLNDLSNVLRQYDQQGLTYKSDQARTGLDIAQQLSGRQLQVDTANAGNQAQAYGINQQAAQAQAQAALDAWKTKYQVGQDALQQANLDRTYNLDENKYKSDAELNAAQAAAATAKANATSGATAAGYIPVGDTGYDTQSGPQQVLAQAAQVDPNRAEQYYGFLNSVATDIGTNLDANNQQTFIRQAIEKAQKSGLSPAAAAAAASVFWTKIMNRH